MKNPHRIPLVTLLVTTLLALTGCSKAVLDYRNAEMPDGLIYATGANEPFTGTVTHVPDSFLQSDAKGYAKFVQETGRNSDAVARFIRFARGCDSPTFLCDVSVRKGYVDGPVTQNLGHPRIRSLDTANIASTSDSSCVAL